MANIQYCLILQPGVLQQNPTLQVELFKNQLSCSHNHKENPKTHSKLSSTLDIYFTITSTRNVQAAHVYHPTPIPPHSTAEKALTAS